MRLFLIAALSAATLLAQSPAKNATKKEGAKPAVAAKAEATPKTATVPGFVGNKDSKIFHKPDCSAAAKIKGTHKTTFATQAEAEKAGFKACKLCFR